MLQQHANAFLHRHCTAIDPFIGSLLCNRSANFLSQTCVEPQRDALSDLIDRVNEWLLNESLMTSATLRRVGVSPAVALHRALACPLGIRIVAER